MNEPTTWTIAIGVLALLLCLRRRRTGEEAKRGGAEGAEVDAEGDAEESMARDEAFTQFNSDFP